MEGAVQIEKGRLARAIWLEVEPLGVGRCFRVWGGARMHFVNLERETCCCEDLANQRRFYCSHILASYLREGEPTVLGALREIVDRPASLPRARRLVRAA